MAKSYEFDTNSKDKALVFQQAARILLTKSFKLIELDITRPWGFFLSVDETEAEEFIKEFYDGIKLDGIDPSLPLRPKFLGIEPGKRLSWQYHHRRAEIWHCLAGEFELVTSDTDEEDKRRKVSEGQVVNMPQGMRHRGVGLESWALIAEIWQHTEPDNPSNEDDIVRVQDDFGR
jgi:mannose-6-phosphate isomerase-like protein (cupin superfamily)